jgi:hypothetical protein
MRPDLDPSLLTLDERRREVAAILAAGLLRLRARAALPTDPGQVPGPENLPETGPDCLEVPAETVLSVHTG